nr:hypothetical protein [uncultured Desulfobacter sp.]
MERQADTLAGRPAVPWLNPVEKQKTNFWVPDPWQGVKRLLKDSWVRRKRKEKE